MENAVFFSWEDDKLDMVELSLLGFIETKFIEGHFNLNHVDAIILKMFAQLEHMMTFLHGLRKYKLSFD